MEKSEAPAEIQPSWVLRLRDRNQGKKKKDPMVESSQKLKSRAIGNPSEERTGGGDDNGNRTKKRAAESASPVKRKSNGVAVDDQSSSKRKKGTRSAPVEKKGGNFSKRGSTKDGDDSKGGAFRVFPGSKKAAELKEDVVEVDLSTPIASYGHPLKKRKLGKKSSPIAEVKSGRGRPRKEPESKNVGGVHVKGESNSGLKLTPDMPREKPEPKNVGGVYVKGESNCERKHKPGSRAERKEKVRDQIKKTLLDAGWTIQLRPRNGRDYNDSVYVPPGRIGGFWSITKAYAYFVDKCTDKNNDTEFSPIPTDQLIMLKKNMVKTRTSNKKNKGSRGLNVRGANQEGDDYVPYKWKRTVLSWMIDSGVLLENAKVKYKETENVKDGVITRDGICCDCCKEIFSVLKFQMHAGGKAKHPFQYIFDESGISLLQCQINAWEKQDDSQRKGFCGVDVEGGDPHDDTCPVCGDGGDLICCDSCPSTFHMKCLDIEALPGDEWHCRNCSCKFCGLPSVNATSPLISCSHCDQKYHPECVPKEHDTSRSSEDRGWLFCGQSCRKVFKQLHELIGVKNELETGFSWSLIHRSDECQSTQPLEVECNSKVSVAFAIMDECFLPISDYRSDMNLIRNVVYNCGSNIPRLNFSRFYTIILEREDEMVAAASIRFHGTRLAEMPFIGTRIMYRRQGMCHRLFEGIESALRSLNVEELTIPAISELTETWTGSFGFKSFESSQGQEIKSINVLAFPYVGILQKPILKSVSQ